MAITVRPPAGDHDEVISAINTPPLVDVMLVLLIIFLITIPVVTTSVPVRLPKERAEVRETRPETIVISVDRAGSIYWHDTRLANVEALAARLRAATQAGRKPEVQIRGDLDARYESVGRIVHACQRAGITNVWFITEPAPLGG